MAYVNVGARISGERPNSKKALKEALRDAPDTVTFDRTSPLDGSDGSDITPATIQAGQTLTVTGPDPYRARKWYATVKLSGKGGISLT